MFIKLHKIQLCFIAATFFLCQCTKAVSPPALSPVKAVNKKVINPYPLATSVYLAQSKTQQGEEQQKSLLLAAGRMIKEGQWRQAETILAQTDTLTATMTDEKDILLAQINLMHNKPALALNTLAEVTAPERLPTFYQIQYHEVQAQALGLQGQMLESIRERMMLNPLLADIKSEKRNLKSLWHSLTGLSQDELEHYRQDVSRNSELYGWFELSHTSRAYRNDAKALIAALSKWQIQFPDHPANRMFSEPLEVLAGKLLNQPKKIALLLPLSGPLSGPGQAIQDGFMAAYQANKTNNSITVKAYDTQKGRIEILYEQAIAEGAEYVVGPLLKSQVAQIAAIPHPVPTLLLNDSTVTLQDNSYLFGLSPTNEAIQVAVKAKQKGYSRALVIAPKTDWGNDVANVFINQWKLKGGVVADTFFYAAHDDLNKNMQQVLHISDSQERERKLKQILGQNIQAFVSRRHDFDMVFLLAYPSKARQIMPLLKYYYAGDVPVFATSSVYSGTANSLKDKDLDGLLFCDIPWVFAHQMGTRNWPEQFNSYNRLYALGRDSYTLASQLNQLLLFPVDGKEEQGALYLKGSKKVARVLEWGQFRQGLAHSISLSG